MDTGLDFDEKLEKDILTACKKRYHILEKKPSIYLRACVHVSVGLHVRARVNVHRGKNTE